MKRLVATWSLPREPLKRALQDLFPAVTIIPGPDNTTSYLIADSEEEIQKAHEYIGKLARR